MTAIAGIVVAGAIIAVPSTAPSIANAQSPRAEIGWLSAVNDFRGGMGLRNVIESEAMSRAAELHSTYMVRTGYVEHGELGSSEWSTQDGRDSGNSSNVAGGSGGTAPSQLQTVQMWIEAPFHRFGLMRAAWRVSGYSLESGRYDSEDRWGATLNVLGGLTGSSATRWPQIWPNARRTLDTTYLAFERIEWPDPAVGCGEPRGTTYGTPISVSFGPGRSPVVKKAILRTAAGVAVPMCVHTSATYKKKDYTDVGWRFLAEANSVLMLPRAALRPGTTYKGRLVLADGRVARLLFSTER